MSSKRASTAPAAPKPPTSLSPTLTIAEHASLVGSYLITLGANTVVHPRAKLNSTYGPITVGSNCIISERSMIGLQGRGADGEGVVIEDGVIVEVGATVESKVIGEGCVIEVNAKVGRGSLLGTHCKIGPLCEVAEDEVLPDYTVLFANGMRRIDNSGVEDLKLKMVARQIDVLRRLIPSNLTKFQ
ncbi:Trimeric LpxA-like enzyme [Glarea lozoyensis ATCC 20868]|uniref:Dynactin subunit 6 n=1 Tax=Glarea lozoyensis (strain ATCC 20868 / MF5171) TaxID=1116229 RepID=S3CMQ8_GLAL2|nr:Trimeric LpxA-like enzyme [Glarea lozoyensis ATCC 20868]EPE27762.1 Trimeric LpxA-like enzyme [Glarea lozoyensis ATCC 20868]